MTRVEKAIERVKELLGVEFTVNKSMSSCNIVKQVNEFGGQATIARFNTIKELESFLDGIQNLKWHGIKL